jgi:hypothetical protein
MPSLSTSQLVVLWYGGIFVTITLWAQREEVYKALAVAVLSGLLICTLNPHPEAKKGWVAFWISPILVILGLFIYSKFFGPIWLR